MLAQITGIAKQNNKICLHKSQWTDYTGLIEPRRNPRSMFVTDPYQTFIQSPYNILDMDVHSLSTLF